MTVIVKYSEDDGYEAISESEITDDMSEEDPEALSSLTDNIGPDDAMYARFNDDHPRLDYLVRKHGLKL